MMLTAQDSYRCLIVEDETLVGLGLQAELENLGHTVVAHAASADEAQRFFREQMPDLVLTDIRLAASDGIELAERLLKIKACPILIVTAYSDRELIERASAAGVFGYLVKPVTQAALAAQIGLGVARFRDHMALVAEKQSLAASLENRKIIDRAKGILMQRLSLSEPEAHKKLQTESQRRRISSAEMARKIVESDELLQNI